MAHKAPPRPHKKIVELLRDFVDPDPCDWDHNHSCQAHGYFYLDQGELCPHEEAKRYLKAWGVTRDADGVWTAIEVELDNKDNGDSD